MQRSSAEMELEETTVKLNQLSIRRQQLNERHAILTMLKNFRHQTGRGIIDTKEEAELVAIQNELDILSVNKKDLLETQERLDRRLHKSGSSQDMNHSPDSMKAKENTGFDIYYVENPPDIPAPKVFTDVEELPPYPANTRCPHCQSYVTTEIVRTVGPVVWLVCTMTSLIGCVAGCCFIPFCIDHFKDMNHKCPKCRTILHTVKKL